MTDLWSFLLQTLTAAGAAAFLLVVKYLFRDKLSPRWQFGIWGLLALVLLHPAGQGGRYVLLNWPLWLETLKTALTGDYSLIRVVAPIPLPAPLGGPQTPLDVLYLLYVAGVVVLLVWYALTYLRLRLALRRGTPADDTQLRRVAAQYDLPLCRAVEVEGLPSAFVCGVIRPVLALPAGQAVDDKVILHELLHLKYHDAAWGLLICLFRCLHWCNPLLWYCADRAGNDAEALCDQRVLERLEGEDRRDYGIILLSMASGRYARAPGTSSMANGGRNIRERIEAIARFKRYPAGMALASVCVALVLLFPLVLGQGQTLAKANGLGHSDELEFHTAMASARLTPCTTAAGALDAYGKAVIEQNGIYRALCAPIDQQADLAAQMEAFAHGPDNWVHEHWESGLPGRADHTAGYFLYNLTETDGGYTAVVVFPLQLAYLDGSDAPPVYETENGNAYAAWQAVRAERQGDRWVVLPQGAFQVAELQLAREDLSLLRYGDPALPAAVTYAADVDGLRLEIAWQTVHTVDNAVETGGSWFFGPSATFDTRPKPSARFDAAMEYSYFTGSETVPGAIDLVDRYAAAPVWADGSGPALAFGSGQGSSSDGAFWGIGRDFGGLSGGGGSGCDPDDPPARPDHYRMVLSYVDGQEEQIVELRPVEGGDAP
ncbi:M56 family metallopeptidase [Intestinimonas aquisgranensis]|uniref:M56 family metallopeptidase n=1 Tax=Intestinimonas timonensis TaxID=1689270 RepID=UPI001D0E2BB3|nr:M56 family metallopeptidase [Intestinimonas timonensis]MCC2259537.1 M56 family metallopeptidase [Intestinimonas aquisgranensis]